MAYQDLLDGIIDKEVIAQATNSLGRDYDYGLAKKGVDNRLHYSDEGKMPWHPTFSRESAYASDKYPGGVWGKEGNYTPSLEMLRDGRAKGLANYMLRVEPNSKLLVPPPVRKSYFIDKTH